jgi:hypothetical protein
MVLQVRVLAARTVQQDIIKIKIHKQVVNLVQMDSIKTPQKALAVKVVLPGKRGSARLRHRSVVVAERVP